MGGVAKSQVLAAFQPHMFFDDQQGHCDSAATHVQTGRVPIRIAPEIADDGEG
jgi:5'-nucleotidase